MLRALVACFVARACAQPVNNSQCNCCAALCARQERYCPGWLPRPHRPHCESACENMADSFRDLGVLHLSDASSSQPQPALQHLFEEPEGAARPSTDPFMPLSIGPPPSSASNSDTTARGAARAALPAALLAALDDSLASVIRSSTDADSAAPPLRIAICQMHAAAGDVAKNLATINHVLDALHGPSDGTPTADLVVFPEVFLQGYHIGPSLLRSIAVAVPTAAQFAVAASASEGDAAAHPLVAISRLARSHGVAVLIAFAETAASEDLLYNSVALFDADGELLRVYRKTHLWGAYEKAVFKRGPAPGTLAEDVYTPVTLKRFPHIPLGLLICFDLEFPEPCRLLALRGAKCTIACLASGEEGGFTSRKMVPTLAAQNDMFVIYTNYPSSSVPEMRGPSGRPVAPDAEIAVYSGGSTVSAPNGDTVVMLPVYVCSPALAPKFEYAGVISGRGYDADTGASVTKRLVAAGVLDASADEALLIVHIDPDAPEYVKFRSRCPYMADRRAELFAGLSS